MLKHGLITDKQYWDTVVSITTLHNDKLDIAIKQSVYIKNEIVLQDPYEKNIRKKLNFGHTVGHAVESYFLKNEAKEILLHGEAIAIGMITEAHISMQKKMLSPTEYNEIKKVLLNVYEKSVLTMDDIEAVIEIMAHDKKNEFGNIQFVLLNSIGNSSINHIVEKPLILKAFKDYLY